MVNAVDVKQDILGPGRLVRTLAGIVGVVIIHHEARGLVYVVKHRDGTIGQYGPSEIRGCTAADLIGLDPLSKNATTPRYWLKGVKTFRGRDGSGLNAVLMHDTKAVANVLDEGCGGMVDFDWLDQQHGKSAEEAAFKGFIKETVPPDPEDKESTLSPATLEQFAMEQWVNAEVDRMSNDKRFRKACKTKTLFQAGDEIGGDDFLVLRGVGSEVRTYIEKKYAGQKIRVLNDEFA